MRTAMRRIARTGGSSMIRSLRELNCIPVTAARVMLVMVWEVGKIVLMSLSISCQKGCVAVHVNMCVRETLQPQLSVHMPPPTQRVRWRRRHQVRSSVLDVMAVPRDRQILGQGFGWPKYLSQASWHPGGSVEA